jgi:hypothetical protein
MLYTIYFTALIGAYYILIYSTFILVFFSHSLFVSYYYPLTRDIFLYEENASEYGGNVLPR